MPVIGAAHELWDARESSFDGGIWTRSRSWLVQTSLKTDRENIVMGALGLPAYADKHPADIFSFAKTISYSQKSESPLAWVVTCGYSSELELNEDPELDEPSISWDSEIYQQPIFKDVSGNSILNSAGDYFTDPMPTRESAHLIAKISANVSSVPAWALSYQNAVNADAIKIGGLVIASRLAKMQRLSIGPKQKRGSYPFYTVSFEIHLQLEGWHLEPLDAGFYQIVAGEREPCKIGGSEVTMPVTLNGAGVQLELPTPETSVYGNFQIYNEYDLSVLPGVQNIGGFG